MPTSNKTPILGLSLWEESDKPRRMDFVEDNQALENILGRHYLDNERHLNAETYLQLHEPFEVRIYTGSGGASRSFAFEFTPQIAVVWAVDKGAAEYTGTCTKQYAGLAAVNGHSMGISINGMQVTVQQVQSVPESGSMAALNESGVTYLLLACR